MTVAFRSAELGDGQFVVSSWSRSYKPSRQAGIIASEDWESVMHLAIQKLLNRRGVRTVVAFDTSDPSFLYGFIAGDTTGVVPVVHYAYVKEQYRRAGYARSLLGALGIEPMRPLVYTCWTPMIQRLSSKIPLAKHDPNRARYHRQDPHGNDAAQEQQQADAASRVH